MKREQEGVGLTIYFVLFQKNPYWGGQVKEIKGTNDHSERL